MGILSFWENFSQNFFQTKKTYFVLVIFVVLFTVAVPTLVDASWGWLPWNWLDETTKQLAEFFVRAIVTGISFIPAFIFFLVAGLTTWFINIVMNIGVAPGSTITPLFVTEGWNFSRQFVNMLFLLVLVFIGLATILRLKEYELQKTLPRLIGIALLVNFSGVFVGLIVDIGNLLTNFFISSTGAFGSGSFTQIWEMGSAYIEQLVATSKGPMDLLVAGVVYGLILWIFYTVSALAYFAIFLIFFLRQIVLWTIVILAPIAFAAYILPATRGWWTRWLSSLTQWAFVGVPIGFFLWLSNRVMNAGAGTIYSSTTPALTGGSAAFSEIIGLMMVPFTGIALLLVGIALSLSMAPSSIRGIANLTKKVAVIGAGVATGFIASQTLSRMAESGKFRGRMERMAASNPNWGKDEQGRNRRGLGAWAQRTVGGTAGFAQRRAGRLAMNAVVQVDENQAQKAGKRAQAQNVIQNLGDLANARTASEKREIVKAMVNKKQMRDAANPDVVGTKNVLKSEQIHKAHEDLLRARDLDTAEALERAFVRSEGAKQIFAATYDKKTQNAADQYGDRTGGKRIDRKGNYRDANNNIVDENAAIDLPSGVSSEEYDSGVRSFGAKVIKNSNSAEDIAQLQRGWYREEELRDAALEFWGGNQAQQAGVRFGQEFLNTVENVKNEKGLDWFLTPTERGRDAEGNMRYDARNTSFARWTASTGAQNLGISPFEGAEGTTEVNSRTRVARQWAEQYNKVPGIQDSYKALMQVLGERRAIARQESLPQEARPTNYQQAIDARKIKQAYDFGTLHDKMRAHANPEVRRLWSDTMSILKLTPPPVPPGDEGLDDMGMPVSGGGAPRRGPGGGTRGGRGGGGAGGGSTITIPRRPRGGGTPGGARFAAGPEGVQDLGTRFAAGPEGVEDLHNKRPPSPPSASRTPENTREIIARLQAEMSSFEENMRNETNPEAIQNWQQAMQNNERDLKQAQAELARETLERAQTLAETERARRGQLSEGRGPQVPPPNSRNTPRRKT